MKNSTSDVAVQSSKRILKGVKSFRLVTARGCRPAG